jgi:hypothetical protein
MVLALIIAFPPVTNSQPIMRHRMLRSSMRVAPATWTRSETELNIPRVWSAPV